MKRPARLPAAIVVLTMVGLACNLPLFGSSTPPAAATLGHLYTAAALTVEASSPRFPTATPTASATKPFPTLPGFGPSRTPLPVTRCDAASFVKDVTIPDGATLDPGNEFTKTWRIQNSGTCTWTPGYALVFVNGDRMSAPASLGLSSTVNPGQSIDLSVRMDAPESNGQYQGFWKLRNAAGYMFGIGAQAQGAFWVKILVAGPAYTAYDFATRYCDAAWENNNRDLPCPGSEGEDKGYVIKLDNPVMESGKTEDQPGLLTVPKDTYNGLILAKYPAVKIREGDRFQALVNCSYRAQNCNVIFSLDYQIGDGRTRNLGRWNEAYEGKFYPVDLDLSALAGEYVKFTLAVSTNGVFDEDQALWFAPRITRRGTPPSTATPTPTATRTSAPLPSITPTRTAIP